MVFYDVKTDSAAFGVFVAKFYKRSPLWCNTNTSSIWTSCNELIPCNYIGSDMSLKSSSAKWVFMRRSAVVGEDYNLVYIETTN